MKFFKNHMGVPFVSYLNDYRLTLAARALAEGQEDVLTVAMDVGFSNVSYFNRLFKKKFGDASGIPETGRKKVKWDW